LVLPEGLPEEQQEQQGPDAAASQQASAPPAAGTLPEHAHHAGKPPTPQHMGLLSGEQGSVADDLIPPQEPEEP
jgi:hypothetical protein